MATKNSKTRKTSDALAILRRRSGIDPKQDVRVQQFARQYDIAQMIYDAREKAGLTQQELAAKIGTRQSVISRLEHADYESQSLAMLERIAQALNLKVELRLVPAKK
jgi:ribosome-binding protein aMBF1 (putative translation factor)